MRLLFIIIINLFFAINVIAQVKVANPSLFNRDSISCQIDSDSLKEKGDMKYCSGRFRNGYYLFMSQNGAHQNPVKTKFERLGVCFKFTNKDTVCPPIGTRGIHQCKIFFQSDTNLIASTAGSASSSESNIMSIESYRCKQNYNCRGELTIMLFRSYFTKADDLRMDILKTKLVKAIRFEAWGKTYDVSFTEKQSREFRTQFLNMEN